MDTMKRAEQEDDGRAGVKSREASFPPSTSSLAAEAEHARAAAAAAQSKSAGGTTRSSPLLAPLGSATLAAQRPAPPQLTLNQGLFASPHSILDWRTSKSVGATPGEVHDADGYNNAFTDEPLSFLAHPTDGLSSLSEALAHFVDADPQRETDASKLVRGQVNDSDSASHPLGDADKKYTEQATAIGSSRSSTAASAETGLTSPSGKSQLGHFSPVSVASGATEKVASHAAEDSPRIDSSSRQGSQVQGDETIAPSLIPRPSTTRRPSHPVVASLQDSTMPASSISRSASGTGLSAAALLHKVQDEHNVNSAIASAGTSSGKNSGQSSAVASGISTPVSHVKMVGTPSAHSKPTVTETHHLQLQTHGPSGRRMINQYVIENELGRGVHGKVRLARDTETGERVAVKIVEREGKKRLGGQTRSKLLRSSASAMGKGKEPSSFPFFGGGEHEESGVPRMGSETAGSPNDIAVQHARFAANLPGSSRGLSSPTSTIGGARFGRWGEGASSRPTYADLERERQRERERVQARKRLLWTTDQKVKREIAILKKCAHSNVVRLKEVIDDPHSKKIFMVLEYMEGGEIQWKDERGFPTMTIDETRRTMRDVVLGLEYLHYQGIIHRDIKPANLLCDANGRVKISDFGVSHFSYAQLIASGGFSGHEDEDDADLTDDRELAKTAGSPAFFAPELCRANDQLTMTRSVTGHTQSDLTGTAGVPAPESASAELQQKRPTITKAIDVWALGVTLYCLLFGHVPFTADSEYALFSVIAKEDYALPAFMGADRIRIGPRRKRWTASQPWLDEEGDVDPQSSADEEPDADESTLSEEARLVRDLLDRLLEKDSNKRIKLEDVKKHPWLVQDIADPPAWLSETDPTQLPFVQVSHEEVQGALTGFSKLKQTVKRLQSKLLTAFGAGEHDFDEEHGHEAYQAALHDRRQHHFRFGRRPRSKSASNADSSEQVTVKRPGQEEGKDHALDAETRKSTDYQNSARTHKSRLPFHRRRSAALDAIKQDLKALQIADQGGEVTVRRNMASAFSTQPQSPHPDEHMEDPMSGQFVRDLTDSSLVWVEGGGDSLPSAEMLGVKRAKKPHRFFKRASSRQSSDIPSNGSHGRMHGRHLFQYSNRSNSSSHGSVRASDLPGHHATSAIPGSAEEQLQHFQSEKTMPSGQSSSRGTAASSPQRSRVRLGDVFRNVWHTPHTHKGQVSGAPAASDIKALEDETAMAMRRESSHKDHLNADSSVSRGMGRPAGFSDAGISFPVSGPQTALLVEHAMPGTAGSQGQASTLTQQGGSGLPGIAVDDYEDDLDLDLSDDDLEDANNGTDRGRPLLHMNNAGWVTGGLRRQHSAAEVSGSHTCSGSDADSLTPSVEGGYNVFKPPYVGASKRTMSSDAAVPRISTVFAKVSGSHALGTFGNPAYDIGDNADAAALRRAMPVASGSGQGASAGRESSSQTHDGEQVGDVSAISDDRFADADENDEGYVPSAEEEGASENAHYYQEQLTDAERCYAPHSSASRQDRSNHSPWQGQSHSQARSLGADHHTDCDEEDDEDGLNFKARRA